jgi:hypothetical protein
MRRQTALLVAGLAVGSLIGAASSAQAGINGRQHRQQARIAQGVRSGELTGREAARLERQERQIRREERLFRADGHLSPAERADLDRDLNRTSRNIYRQKHDGQTR